MPLYEYKCNECSSKFEALVLSPDDEINCPECESASLEKLFSTFGVKSEGSLSDSSSIPVSGGCCTPTGCGCKH